MKYQPYSKDFFFKNFNQFIPSMTKTENFNYLKEEIFDYYYVIREKVLNNTYFMA